MARASSLPQIPSLPSSNGDPTINGILSVLNPVKEILEIYQGNKGNSLGLDRVVRFNDIAILDPTTFSQTRASYARIVRVSGNIVRTGKIESTDSTTYFDLDNDKLVFNGKINYASKMPGIFLGKDDDNTYKFNIGYDDKGSLKFDGVNTYLGLWSITPNGIGDNLTENSSKIFLDKTNTRIRVGPTNAEYILIDGGNVLIQSSNYVSGVAGAGFFLDEELLETQNIAARGIIRTAVFQKDVVSAVGGNLMLRPADVLYEDFSEEDVGGVGALLLETDAGMLLEDGGKALGETGGGSYLTIEGNETFSVGNILRIKDGLDDEWMEVTNIDDAPQYIVTRDKAEDYAENENPEWTKGATVVNYGVSGDGGVYMTASESNAPYLSIWTHAGSPWDTITTHLRLGNLNGFLGYSSDLYGIAIGSTNKYLKYDPTNHLRIQGNITVTGDNGFVKIYDGDPTERVRLGNLNGFLGYSSDLYGIAIGETNKSLTYDPTNGLVITGPGITAGALQSADWAAALGVRLDLTNKYLKMGGSNVDYAGSAAGIFLGLDTLYKFYVGDGSINYVKFDGVNLLLSGGVDVGTTGFVRTTDKTSYSDTDAGFWLGYDSGAYKLNIGDSTDYLKFDGIKVEISLSNANALTLKSGGGMLVESGGDIELQGDNSNPGKLLLTGTSGSIEHWIYRGTYEGYYYINPTVDDSLHCYFGSLTNRFQQFDVVTSFNAKLSCMYSGTRLGSVGCYATSTYGIGYLNAKYDGSNYITLRAYADNSGGTLEADIDGSGYSSVIPLSSSLLKTGTGTASASLGALAYADIAMQDYCFFPNMGGVTTAGMFSIYAYSTTAATYVGRFAISNNDAGTPRIYSIYWRYITATDEAFFYIIRDKTTGEVLATWACTDPPAGFWGLDEKPEDFVPPIIMTPEPPNFEDVTLFKYPMDGYKEIIEKARKDNKSIHEHMNDFDYDSNKKLFISKNLSMI